MTAPTSGVALALALVSAVVHDLPIDDLLPDDPETAGALAWFAATTASYYQQEADEAGVSVGDALAHHAMNAAVLAERFTP
jgi:hypothetical protein